MTVIAVPPITCDPDDIDGGHDLIEGAHEEGPFHQIVYKQCKVCRLIWTVELSFGRDGVGE